MERSSSLSEDLKSLLIKNYQAGENASDFNAETTCCGRYLGYCKLCTYASDSCCTVDSPEQGSQVISAYITSQPKTCDGKVVSEENFGPQSIEMSETIDQLQKEDIERYFAMRVHHNPERDIATTMDRLCAYAVIGLCECYPECTLTLCMCVNCIDSFLQSKYNAIMPVLENAQNIPPLAYEITVRDTLIYSYIIERSCLAALCPLSTCMLTIKALRDCTHHIKNL